MVADTQNRRAWRHNIEWERKSLHLLATFLAVWIFVVEDPLATLGLAAVMVFVLSVDASRIRSRRWGTHIYRVLPFVFRTDEARRWSGASIMAVGCTLTSALFPSGPAIAGILCLTWGDSAAALTGQFWAHRRRPEECRDVLDADTPAVRKRGRKTLAGSLGCFVVSSLMILLVNGAQWDILLLGALTATLMERWTHGAWDNLTIPLATAGVIHFSLIWLR